LALNFPQKVVYKKTVYLSAVGNLFKIFTFVFFNQSLVILY